MDKEYKCAHSTKLRRKMALDCYYPMEMFGALSKEMHSMKVEFGMNWYKCKGFVSNGVLSDTLGFEVTIDGQLEVIYLPTKDEQVLHSEIDALHLKRSIAEIDVHELRNHAMKSRNWAMALGVQMCGRPTLDTYLSPLMEIHGGVCLMINENQTLCQPMYSRVQYFPISNRVDTCSVQLDVKYNAYTNVKTTMYNNHERSIVIALPLQNATISESWYNAVVQTTYLHGVVCILLDDKLYQCKTGARNVHFEIRKPKQGNFTMCARALEQPKSTTCVALAGKNTAEKTIL